MNHQKKVFWINFLFLTLCVCVSVSSLSEIQDAHTYKCFIDYFSTVPLYSRNGSSSLFCFFSFFSLSLSLTPVTPSLHSHNFIVTMLCYAMVWLPFRCSCCVVVFQNSWSSSTYKHCSCICECVRVLFLYLLTGLRNVYHFERNT